MRAFLVASHCLLLGVASAALAADPVAAPPLVDKSQEIVCRKEKETGSLVKTKKTCHSRAQWQYIDETNQAQTRAMQDDMRTRPGSN
jgi:Spy/CpxP family protein refolding chaperone